MLAQLPPYSAARTYYDCDALRQMEECVVRTISHGEITAVLVPPSLTPYERLLAAGKMRQPVGRSVDLRRIGRTEVPDRGSRVARPRQASRTVSTCCPRSLLSMWRQATS